MTEKELEHYKNKIEQTKEHLDENSKNIAEKTALSIIEFTNSVEDPLSPNFNQEKNPWTKTPKKKKIETITFGFLEYLSRDFFHEIGTPFQSLIRMLTALNSGVCFILENGECWEQEGAYFAKDFALTKFQKHDIEQIDRCAGGYSHYLLISKSGYVYWRNLKKFPYGQMGSGENINFSKPTKIKFFEKLKEEEGIQAVDVKGAGYSSFYLCNNGDLYSSGSNKNGECFLPKWNQNYFTPELVTKNVKKIWGEVYSWKAFFQTNDNKVFCKTKRYEANQRFFVVLSLPMFKDQIILEVGSNCAYQVFLTQSTHSEKQFLHSTTDIYKNTRYEIVDLSRVNSPLIRISATQGNFVTTTQNNDIYCLRDNVLDKITKGVPEMEDEKERYIACSTASGFFASVSSDSKSSLTSYKNEETKNFIIKVKIDNQEDENEEDEDFEEIPVHKFILIARSGLFREMFKTLNRNEEDNSVVDFSIKTLESLEIFFKYLYTNTIELTADDDPQLTVEELEDAYKYYHLTEKFSLQSEIMKIKKQYPL
ncbi:btk-binding protein-related [Anaeramoeba flamelloides]|uniref:Btk-binding protein-related n=1 Tax=Anaeramoeba flamelloides TaxID=1746091 RepID=A0AAV8A309_9EUKA|nr:btk-binding protein-related [Anaeramoeba flamelloides]